MDISGISENGVTPSAAEQMAAILAQQTTYQFRPAYRFKTPLAVENAEGLTDSTGRKIKRGSTNVRRHVDHFPYCLNYVHHRYHVTTPAKRPYMQPHILYSHEGWIPHDCLDDMEDCIPTKFVRAALNKHKCPIFAISWTPEGKRLITGGSRGEFTLWNGSAFNFETILQAHDQAIRALKWTGDKQWLVSGDGHGYIKYWQQNMNNVHMFQAHEEQPIRCISFSPTDTKFVTSSDDGTAKVWDFYRSHLEQTLTGHGSEVFSAEWHPFKGIIATGSRDTQQPVKLWDPRTGKNLATLFEHKNSVMSVKWNGNGNWLATGSRDHSVKLYDIRMLKEIFTFKAHKKEVSCVAWHPIHTNLLSSGGMDGSLAFWDTRAENDVVFMDNAHDQAIWTMEWHPFGHIFATGANDHNTKFWVRNRPGDLVEDIFGINAKDVTNVISGPTILNATTKKEEVESQTDTPHAKGATRQGVQAISSFFKAKPTVPGICLAKKEGEGEQVGGHQVEVVVQGSVNVPPTSYGKRTLIKQTPTGRPKRVLECDFDFHGSPTMERHVGEVGEGGAYIEGYRIQKQSFLGNGRALKM